MNVEEVLCHKCNQVICYTSTPVCDEIEYGEFYCLECMEKMNRKGEVTF